MFIIVVKLENASPPILIEDMAELNSTSQATKCSLRSTMKHYLPDLLKKLWETEGRNKVHQPNRFEVIVDDPKTEITGMIVLDPRTILKEEFTMQSSE